MIGTDIFKNLCFCHGSGRGCLASKEDFPRIGLGNPVCRGLRTPESLQEPISHPT